MVRQLFLWHRWLGIILCLFMSAWFISGIVMLYVGYPKLTPAEHLAHLPALSLSDERCCVSVFAALERTGQSDTPDGIKLSSIAGQPYYLFQYRDEPVIAIHAETGERLSQVDEALALASAQAFFDDATPEYIGLIDQDAWTQSRGLDSERPLHLVQIHDDAQRFLYISSHNGIVIRDATRIERTWGWLGAWLHWLYPVRSLPWWSELVIYLSLAATFMSLTGQYLGLKRWRFSRPYRNGSGSPYPAGHSRWHHLSGLLFGLFLIAWIFSGLMSMRPWGVLSNQSTLDASVFRGDIVADLMNTPSPAELIQIFEQSGLRPHELEWTAIAGQIWITAYQSDGQSRTLSPANPERVYPSVPHAVLTQTARQISPQHQMNITWLYDYDFYYVAREQQSMYGHLHRPLPILRVQFDDPDSTWYHINPDNGTILQTLTHNQRINRWLFNLLHSWDWHILLARPGLREALIIAFSLGGLVICVSGTMMGYRRLKKQSQRLTGINGAKTPNRQAGRSRRLS